MTEASPVLVTLGTRPEAIKLAPVIEALRAHGVETRVCSTGQHRELLDDALVATGITPDVRLDVMRAEQDLNALSARVLGRMREVLQNVRPRLVVVQGDTTTAMAAALAAYYEGIGVAHVEAGLRTDDITDPWPEEANRRIITRLAEVHFAPTEQARANLLAEGVAPEKVIVTGNSSIDALEQTTRVGEPLEANAILVTCHRRGHERDDYVRLVAAVRAMCENLPDHTFVLPEHPRPSLRAALERLDDVPNLHRRTPFTYPEMLRAIETASAVVTDSGGVQEEAARLATPCVVLREQTDRPGSVATGHSFVSGLEPDRVVSTLLGALDARLEPSDAFGDGRAAERIARFLKDLSEFDS